MLISLLTAFALIAQPALADDVDTAIENFLGAGDFVDDAYAYAYAYAYGYVVVQGIGKGGIGIGGTHGKGEVFVGGKKVGKKCARSPGVCSWVARSLVR